MTGTAGQRRVSQSYLENLQIPVPSRDIQQRLTTQLATAEISWNRARADLKTSADLVFASFLGLFGSAEERRWPTVRFGDLGTLDRGRSKNRPRNAPHLYGGPYPFIQTGDVSNADRYLRAHTQTYSEEGLAQSRLWPANTLCITIAANIGKTAILTYPACFPDSVVGFTPGPDVTIEFIQAWLETVQQRLEETAPEVAQKNINLEILRELACPVPPIELQQRLSDLVRTYEHLRIQQRETARQAEHLFDSLLATAFESAA